MTEDPGDEALDEDLGYMREDVRARARRSGVVPLLGLLSDDELRQLWADLVERAGREPPRRSVGTTWAEMARLRLGELDPHRPRGELDAELELILRHYDPPPP